MGLPTDLLTLFQDPEPLDIVLVPWETAFIPCRIQAGFPSPAAEYEETGLDLNRYLIDNHNATFIFTVVGESMKNVGIMDGDKVTVDRSIEPKHRHIVVAMVNGEFTLKRLYRRAGVVELRAENPDFQPIRFSECDELQVWGVVTGVLRKLAV
jgi:DNA polymerase V